MQLCLHSSQKASGSSYLGLQEAARYPPPQGCLHHCRGRRLLFFAHCFHVECNRCFLSHCFRTASHCCRPRQLLTFLGILVSSYCAELRLHCCPQSPEYFSPYCSLLCELLTADFLQPAWAPSLSCHCARSSLFSRQSHGLLESCPNVLAR